MAEVDGCLPPDAAFNQQLEASVMALKQMLQHRLLSEVFLPTRARGFQEVRNVASGMRPETVFVGETAGSGGGRPSGSLSGNSSQVRREQLCRADCLAIG